MPLIDLDAAIAALTERQSNYREESTTWAQIGLDILTIRALPTVQPEPAPAPGADIDDRLHNAWMNYLHLHQAAYDVWRWFEVSRPDLIGPRVEALRDAVNGPRPYGSFAADTPTPAQLLAEALQLPEVKALADAGQRAAGTYFYHGWMNGFQMGNLRDALAALKGEQTMSDAVEPSNYELHASDDMVYALLDAAYAREEKLEAALAEIAAAVACIEGKDKLDRELIRNIMESLALIKEPRT